MRSFRIRGVRNRLLGLFLGGLLVISLQRRFASLNTDGLGAVVVQDVSEVDLLHLETDLFNRTGSTSQPPLQVAPYERGQAKLVLLLAYQRTGSSFISNILFDNNPDVHFVYEPLDATYSSMYGTSQGWNVPADITTHPDGTSRRPPEHEHRAVRLTLNAIFQCRMSSFPVEMLSHKYYWLWGRYTMKRLAPYASCMRDHHLKPDRVADCRKQHVKSTCPHTYNQEHKNFELCRRWLWEGNYRPEDVMLQPDATTRLMDYKLCLAALEPKTSTCSQILESQCTTSAIRAVKTVRATMESVEKLLRQHPNFRVIHLMRDPRGAVNSRHSKSWTRGHFGGKDIAKEAHVYCQTVLADLRLRKQLEEKYPGRIMELVYEDFVLEPYKNIRRVYEFLDEPLTDQYLKTFSGTLPAIDRLVEWNTRLSTTSLAGILSSCEDFYRETSYEWPIL